MSSLKKIPGILIDPNTYCVNVSPENPLFLIQNLKTN